MCRGHFGPTCRPLATLHPGWWKCGPQNTSSSPSRPSKSANPCKTFPRCLEHWQAGSPSLSPPLRVAPASPSLSAPLAPPHRSHTGHKPLPPLRRLPNTGSLPLFFLRACFLLPQRKETSNFSQFNVYNTHVSWLVYCLDYIKRCVPAGNTSVSLPIGFLSNAKRNAWLQTLRETLV